MSETGQPPAELPTPETRPDLKEVKRVVEILKTGLLHEKIEEPVARLPEVQEAAKAGLITLLAQGNDTLALEFANRFNFSDSIVSLPEVQEAAKSCLMELSANESGEFVVRFVKQFKLSSAVLHSPEVQEIAKRQLVIALSRGANATFEITDLFKIPEAVLHSADFQEAAAALAVDGISVGYAHSPKWIIETFKPPEALLEKRVKAEIMFHLVSGGADRAVNIATALAPQAFLLSPEVQEAAKTRLMFEKKSGRLDIALKIAETFKLPDALIQTQPQATKFKN